MCKSSSNHQLCHTTDLICLDPAGDITNSLSILQLKCTDNLKLFYYILINESGFKHN